MRRKRTDEDVQKDLEEIENQEDAANKEEQQQHLSQAMAPWRRRPTSSSSTEGHKGNVQTTSTAGHKPEAPVSATSELQGAGRKNVIEMVNAIEGAYGRKKDEKDKAKEAEKGKEESREVSGEGKEQTRKGQGSGSRGGQARGPWGAPACRWEWEEEAFDKEDNAKCRGCSAAKGRSCSVA